MIVIPWIVIGLVLGAVARLLRGGTHLPGWLAALITGLVCALFFGWLGCIIFTADMSDTFAPAGLISSAVGTVVVLALWVVLRRRGERDRDGKEDPAADR